MRAAYSFACIFAFLVVAVFATERIYAEDDKKVLKEILDRWEKKQTEFKTAHYKIEGKCFVPQFSAQYPDSEERFPDSEERFPDSEERFPDSEERFEHSSEIHLDFVNDRARRESVWQIFDLSERVYNPEFEIRLFNGKQYQSYIPRKENLALGKDVSEVQPELYIDPWIQNTFHRVDIPILLHHGFVPASICQQAPKPVKLDRELYSYSGDEVMDGRKISVIRVVEKQNSKCYLLFYVDRARDCEITSMVSIVNGHTSYRIDIKLIETKKVWQPKSWTFQSYYSDDVHFEKLGEKIDCKVKVAEHDPSFKNVEFEITPKPGMVILKDGDRYIQEKPGEPRKYIDRKKPAPLPIKARELPDEV